MIDIESLKEINNVAEDLVKACIRQEMHEEDMIKAFELASYLVKTGWTKSQKDYYDDFGFALGEYGETGGMREDD